MKNWNKAFFTVAVLACLVALPVFGQESDLAQAAKEKASTKKARHVYTNDDYPERPDLAAGPTVGATATVANGATVKPANGAEPKAEDGKPAADGKTAPPADPNAAKVADLKKQLEEAKKAEQTLRDQLADLDQKASKEPDEFRRRMYNDMVSNQQVTLTEFQKKQAELEKQIAAAEKTDKKD